ncbi:MAG: hypothetical protein K8W52_38200 [Deltaproteobacteria bacterium]|nr:hypothetical protein [Deltaproteobacteria bacterium]
MRGRPVYEVDVLARGGRWRADIPGAIALLAGIAFVSGITSAEIREMLLGWVLGAGALAIVAFALFLRGRGALLRLLTVARDGSVHLAGAAPIAVPAPIVVTHGCARELMIAGRMHRTVPVLWVHLRGADGTTLLLTRAMGVLDSLPAWPQAPVPAGLAFSSVALDPVRLFGVLAPHPSA